jgi:integrase/recombinase XerC
MVYTYLKRHRLQELRASLVKKRGGRVVCVTGVRKHESRRRARGSAAVRSPRRAWALLLAFGTGMRPTELASVRPEDIQGNEIVVRHGKGGKERRLPVSPLARVAIEELRPWYNGTIVGGVKPSTVTEWAEDAARDSGLREKVWGRPVHVLRSSFASDLLRKGVAVHVVRDLMGREDMATTGLYAVAFDEDREAAVGELDF